MLKKRPGLIAAICLIGVLAAALAVWCRAAVTFARGPYPFARSNAPGPGGRDPQAASPAQQKAAANLIRAQLADVRRGDYAAAASLQSARLRVRFSFPGVFQRMIQTEYPVFAENREVEVGPASEDLGGRQLLAPVVVRGKNGAVVSAVYILVLEGKEYRVEAVLGGFPPRPSRGIRLP